jgi:hypothetical protein
MRVSALAALLAFGGCAAHGGSSAAAAAVAIPVVLAPAIAETAVYKSATGYHCWAVCTEGTRCNAETNTCEPIPCGGGCQPDERCDKSLHPPACVSSSAALKIWKDREGPGEQVR